MQPVSRRTLYRKSKRHLVTLLLRRWAGSRRALERAVWRFLRQKRRTYLLQLLRDKAFAFSIAGAILAGGAVWADPPIELSTIAGGSGGFAITTQALDDQVGWAVAGGGDINGDGVDDVIVGAPYASGYGKAYVVFGKSDATAVDLADVESGTGGFVILGATNSENRRIGKEVGGGGLIDSGDSLADIVLSAHSVFGNYDSHAYVVSGRSATSAVNLSVIEAGTGLGFAITGLEAPSYGRTPVAATGDINGDGKDDLIVGASSETANTYYAAGKSYVVFGKNTSTAVTASSVASGSGGFTIDGASYSDRSGFTVSAVGDMNGDGKDELVVFAKYAIMTDEPSGVAYVVFGKSTGTAINLANVEAGTGGFAIHGFATSPYGQANPTGCGDVNGDGLEDLILASPSAPYGNSAYAGRVYVVFGKSDTAAIDLADIRNGSGGGFTIVGRRAQGLAGKAVGGAGDVNGDGLDDVLVGAPEYNGYSGTPGEVYVVFGKSSATRVKLENVYDGIGGFVIKGEAVYDRAGFSVDGAGDLNGDDLADILIGAIGASRAYVVFAPSQAPVEVGITNASNGDPITSGVVYVERLDAPIGFRAPLRTQTGGAAVYTSPQTDLGSYKVVAAAAKFLPSAPVTVGTNEAGGTAPGIALTPDPGLASPSFLEVSIRVRDALGLPTGQVLVTKSVQLRQDSEDIGLTAMYGQGNMNFIGVPAGDYEVYIPDTTSFTFASANVTIGTGVFETVVVDATLMDPDPPIPSRAALPGLMIGSVLNSDADPIEGYPGALVIHTPDFDPISTFTTATPDGAYVMPDVIVGAGTVQAFTPDGAIGGTSKAVTIVSGQIYGDQPNEDTLLSIGPLAADSDADGLPDSFEDQYFDVSVPLALRGPKDDPDGDGLSNFEEFTADTDPADADSDGDGAEDGLELVLGSDPNDGASTPGLRSEVYVDFGFSDALQAGNLLNPYNTLQDALDALAPDGTIQIKGDVNVTTGTVPGGFTIGAPLSLRALRGTIRIE